MNIHKGKEKLKEISVESFAHRNDPKNKFYFNTASASSEEKVAHMRLHMDHGFTDQEFSRREYNETITQLDPAYTKLKPIRSYIIRRFIKEDQKTQSGLFIPNRSTAEVRTNNGFKDTSAEDPWSFTSKAVIVAVPEFEKFLKPGMIVQVSNPKVFTEHGQAIDYADSYLHPDYPYTDVPKKVTDVHFGYSLVPQTAIHIVLSEIEDDNETKPETGN